jgi:hypothetical protein
MVEIVHDREDSIPSSNVQKQKYYLISLRKNTLKKEHDESELFKEDEFMLSQSGNGESFPRNINPH